MRSTLLASFVALWVVMPFGPARAVTYTFSALNVAGSDPGSVFGSIATGINNRGQVVGTYGSLLSTGLNVENGFLLDLATGASITLTARAATGALLASSINDAGQILGSVAFGSGFETMRGAPFVLDTATGNFVIPNVPTPFRPSGINNVGQILGVLGPVRGFFYQEGYLVDTATGSSLTFSDPRAPRSTVPLGLNDRGQVVGYDSTSPASGILFNVGTGIYTPLNDPLATITTPAAINNIGQVVGSIYDGSLASGFVLDLATSIFTPLLYPGATETLPTAINDAGQIVGYYRSSGSSVRAFLATPEISVPEPMSAALLGGGVLWFGWARWFRRARDVLPRR